MRPAKTALALGTVAVFGTGIVFTLFRTPTVLRDTNTTGAPITAPEKGGTVLALPTIAPQDVRASFVGVRENIPEDAPNAYGFWSFAMPVSGILSRSGQPLISEFAWLKSHGWKSVISLRTDGERGEVGDDAKLPGFANLGLTYVHLPLVDGRPPKPGQAEEFLAFVTTPMNQPVHIHCRGGIGRTGTMTALYRYAVQGWPMDLAIQESRAFQGGVSLVQATWLQEWANTHAAGSHAVTQ